MKTLRKLFMWIIAIVLVIVAVAVGVGYYVSAPVYSGPTSAHFDGKTFTTPGHASAKGWLDVLKWSLNRDQGTWEKQMNLPTGPQPPATVTDKARITFVNHSTFLIQTNGINVLTDPIWSERTSPVSWAGPSRMRPPGIAFEQLPRIHAVLISHNHYDHLDAPTIRRLEEAHQPLFLVPLGVGAYMQQLGVEKVQELDWWQTHPITDQVAVQSVPARHFSGRGMFDRDRTLWCGYVVQRPAEGNIYFAGDTGYADFFEEIGSRSGPIQVALLPIGAYKPEWFMSPVHISPEEAVRIHQALGARVSIAMHYGTFPLADDGMQQPQADLEIALNDLNLDSNDFMLLAEGEGYSFD